MGNGLMYVPFNGKGGGILKKLIIITDTCKYFLKGDQWSIASNCKEKNNISQNYKNRLDLQKTN
jgi:hypothetical protein